MEEVIPCYSRLVPVRELAQKAGITPKAVVMRFRKGWRNERLMEAPYAVYRKDDDKMPPGMEYTEAELFELYKGFADSIEEQTMLADFMGRERNDPEVIITLASFRARRWR